MLHAALHYHSQKHPSTVTDDIAENLHVDNVVTGCTTETEAVEFYKEAEVILSQAKFNLRALASNRKRPKTSAVSDGVDDSADTTKVLRLLWHTPSDTIFLASQITIKQIPITKHKILQNSSSIFDPLGFMTPVTIQAKILLQELWKSQVGWCTCDLQATWYKIAQEIKEATEFTIPRQYFPTTEFHADEMHIFF